VDEERPQGGGAVTLEKLEKRFDDEVAVDGIDLPHRRQASSSPSSAVRLREDDHAADDRRLRTADVGQGAHRRRRTSPTSRPRERPVNTVFQSYALFPHLSVADNVGFGLRFAKVSSDEAKRRVADVLELVRLTRLARRRPNQLSGGQQQRVALARALVLQPRVLLLDEPLGALDAKLRKDLRAELTSLQKAVGITFVFVTHDQEEALSDEPPPGRHVRRQDRAGRPPQEVYEAPATAFVAEFLGVANLFDVEFDTSGTCRVAGQPIRADGRGPRPRPHRGPARARAAARRCRRRPPEHRCRAWCGPGLRRGAEPAGDRLADGGTLQVVLGQRRPPGPRPRRTRHRQPPPRRHPILPADPAPPSTRPERSATPWLRVDP
jgi:energy-coupling factor transporter ATP-binding protein EcfA2